MQDPKAFYASECRLQHGFDVSHSFIDVDDMVTGGAGMLYILAWIHTEGDQAAGPNPGKEHQNR